MNPHDVTHALLRVLASSGPDEIERRTREQLCQIDGVDDVRIWLVDVALDKLRSFSTDDEVELDGTPRARAFTHAETAAGPDVAFVPLRSAEMVVGVMEVRGDLAPSLLDEARWFGTVLASRLLASQEYSDVVHRARNSAELGVATTIQYRQTPVPAYGDRMFEVGGKIEPAYEVAGDGFDFAVNGDTVHFGVFDAVGHGLRATLLTTLALGAYRHARWADDDLTRIAAEVEQAVASQAANGEFVTGVLCHLDGEGRLTVTNAGHLRPVKTTEDSVETLETNQHLPFGLGGEHRTPDRFEVGKGERVFLFSDGIIEARAPSEIRYGNDRLLEAVFRLQGIHETILQTCRAVLAEVLDHVGSPLSDDATLLGVELRNPDAEPNR